MVIFFHHREQDYEDWCNEHKEGYVFNHAGGMTGNVLHVVGCKHLTASRYIGTYTTRYPKYCSDNIKELSDKADEVSKPYGWRQCKDCFK
ncbi:hypothetical protein [Brevibacillus sp. SIMBA_040]|uniref:hypothetical protein n=1 Tax=unclassified Brevibacillus TaxID=2684853 RepID=UPI00397B1E53